MKARKRLDRVLLLVAALLVLTLAAVLVVRLVQNNAEDSSVTFVAVNETEAKAEVPELEVIKEPAEALLELDHLGRSFPEIIDVYPVPTVKPWSATLPAVETDGEIDSSPESLSETYSAATSAAELSDYEKFLNPAPGSHYVDLTLFVAATGGVNLRNEPSTSSLAKHIISYGSPVHVVRLEGDWVEVKLSGGERGFMLGKYLQAIRPPSLETSTTQAASLATEQIQESQTTATSVSTVAPTTTAAPATTTSTTAAPSGNFLLGIANPDPNYAGRPVQVEDRDVLEGLVMGEFGNSYTGAVLVAQAIRDSMTLTGVYNTSQIARQWGYTAAIRDNINATTKKAVAFVFDEGGSAVQHSIYYFYNPSLSAGRFHETQKFVVAYGGCRFFSR